MSLPELPNTQSTPFRLPPDTKPITKTTPTPQLPHPTQTPNSTPRVVIPPLTPVTIPIPVKTILNLKLQLDEKDRSQDIPMRFEPIQEWQEFDEDNAYDVPVGRHFIVGIFSCYMFGPHETVVTYLVDIDNQIRAFSFS